MINIRHIVTLTNWWAKRLPANSSLLFRESFAHELLVLIYTTNEANHLTLQTQPRLSQMLVEAVIFAATNSDEQILAADIYMGMMNEYHYSKVCDGHVFVEERALDGFSAETKLLMPDGSLVDYCVHCYTPIADNQFYCQQCENGTAICLACRKPRAIPTIGLDGVCEGCMQAEMNNQLSELSDEHERQWVSQQEAW